MPRQSTSFFNKKELTRSAGLATGGTTASLTTGALTTAGTVVLSAPLWIGAFLGVLPAQIISAHLSKKYDRILRGSPNLNTVCQFTIRATTTALGMLIGIAAASLTVGLTINPFTLPALVAGGVCASIILGLYLYANTKKSHRREEQSSAALATIYAGTGDSSNIQIRPHPNNDLRRGYTGTTTASASVHPQSWLQDDNSDSSDNGNTFCL